MSEPQKDSFLMGFIKYILPLLLVMAAMGAAVLMVMSKPKPAEKTQERIVPKVEWVTVSPENLQLKVTSQGVVTARRSTMLISEVSGIVEWVSPALYAGGFFEKDELLLKIEPTQYIAAVANAKSLVAQMELLYEQELALSAQAQQDWDDMGKGDPTDLVLRKPQLAKAEADLEFAKASLKQAERNLRFTEVNAPYKGRVREKFVDVGQSVAAKSSQLASVYSVDAAEIRVSFSQQEAGFVNLPESYINTGEDADRPKVVVSTLYAGKRFEWEGILDRTEGVIDPSTRLVYGVAKVENPYHLSADHPEKPPLKVGMFVEVTIEGNTVENAVEIPRGGLKPGDIVYLVNHENRLEIRPVEVVRRGIESVVVKGGFSKGERIVTTRLSAVADGMLLDPVASDSAKTSADKQDMS